MDPVGTIYYTPVIEVLSSEMIDPASGSTDVIAFWRFILTLSEIARTLRHSCRLGAS